MKILYIDCFAGISGDMMLGALLDLGVPLKVLRDELGKLPLPGVSYALSSERVQRKGIAATHARVEVAGDQPHRHYGDIVAMIEGSGLAAPVRETAQRIFRRLAEAEAKVHGVEIEKVHFHEVGAVDSIVDIVGTAIGLDWLSIGEICAAAVPLGSGYIETAHGRLPVPAPATAELLLGLPVHGDIGPGERVTPTGAAVIAALCKGFGRMPAMRVESVGCGAGTRDFDDIPNILRLVMGEKSATLLHDEAVLLETHIDDISPEILGFLMERLLAEGALDAAFSPVQMKKNRPAVKLTVLSSPEKLEHLARLVLTETTTIGVRYHPVARFKLERTVEQRQTSLGPVRVKIIRDGSSLLRIAPEYEECRRIAEDQGLPLLEVYRRVEREVTP
ncbi:MAG: nickel pincer cofactor biosynthesis protein LarC [Geobacter sp.]|nr:nickel pincer cofactor biosynthesis protein LarC [Geobacter sp.]